MINLNTQDDIRTFYIKDRNIFTLGMGEKITEIQVMFLIKDIPMADDSPAKFMYYHCVRIPKRYTHDILQKLLETEADEFRKKIEENKAPISDIKGGQLTI